MDVTAYVVEDEALARQALVQMVRAVPGWQLLGAADNGRTALEDCLQRAPDVLLTDIRMPLLDGLELCAALRSPCPRTQFVFVTAHSEHGVDAFAVAAVDYLLKPVSEADFRRCIERVEATRRQQLAVDRLETAGAPLDTLLSRSRGELRRLVVRSVGRTDIVALDEVTAFVAQRNYVDVVTKTCTWMHRATLKSLTDQLDPGRFVQIHRSAIVAIASIRRIERREGRVHVVVEGGSSYPVGARYLAALHECLGS